MWLHEKCLKLNTEKFWQISRGKKVKEVHRFLLLSKINPARYPFSPLFFLLSVSRAYRSKSMWMRGRGRSHLRWQPTNCGSHLLYYLYGQISMNFGWTEGQCMLYTVKKLRIVESLSLHPTGPTYLVFCRLYPFSLQQPRQYLDPTCHRSSLN